MPAVVLFVHCVSVCDLLSTTSRAPCVLSTQSIACVGRADYCRGPGIVFVTRGGGGGGGVGTVGLRTRAKVKRRVVGWFGKG